jgi:hypothetical protein
MDKVRDMDCRGITSPDVCRLREEAAGHRSRDASPLRARSGHRCAFAQVDIVLAEDRKTYIAYAYPRLGSDDDVIVEEVAPETLPARLRRERAAS